MSLDLKPGKPPSHPKKEIIYIGVINDLGITKYFRFLSPLKAFGQAWKCVQLCG